METTHTHHKDIDLIVINLGYLTGLTFWDTFIGPRLEETDESNKRIMERVKRVFQCANKVGEVVRRHRSALIGNAPSWVFTNLSGVALPDGQAANVAEQLNVLLAHWQRMNIGQYGASGSPLRKVVDNALAGGFGYLRLWSPRKFINSPDPYKKVALHAPDPFCVDVVRDTDGFVDKIKYRYYEDEKVFYEVQAVDPVTNLTNFWTENEKGDRVTLIDPITNQEFDGFVLALGGRYTIYELQREPLITETIRRAQDAINYALTLVPSLNEYAGFLLHLILNGLPPGEWGKDTNGKDIFTPTESIKMSPGSVNFISGLPIGEDPNNPTGYTSPSVNTTAPAAITHLIDTYKLFSSVIYESVGQGHILSNDMQISGISRQQQRADFTVSLLEDAQLIEMMLEDIYMSGLLMLNQNAPQGLFNIAIDVTLQVETGEPLPEDRNTIRDDYGAGLISRKTAIIKQGYANNADAESAAIDEETKTRSQAVALDPLAIN